VIRVCLYPLARFIIAMTSALAFLLLRSAVGLPVAFFVRLTFLADFIFLAGLRPPFAYGAPSSGVGAFSVSIAFVLIVSP
jgi:hypothetical protein